MSGSSFSIFLWCPCICDIFQPAYILYPHIKKGQKKNSSPAILPQFSSPSDSIRSVSSLQSRTLDVFQGTQFLGRFAAELCHLLNPGDPGDPTWDPERHREKRTIFVREKRTLSSWKNYVGFIIHGISKLKLLHVYSKLFSYFLVRHPTFCEKNLLTHISHRVNRMEKLSFKPPGNLCALAGRLDGMGWFFTDHWLANRLRCPWLAIEIVDLPSKNGGSFQFVM